MTNRPLRLGIVGGGRAAWAFGSTWNRLGWPLIGIALRRSHPITELLQTKERSLPALVGEIDLLLLAVSDRAIDEVAATIPPTDAVLFHPSGSVPSVRGGFSLHPLRALPAVGEPSDLADTLLVFEGAHETLARWIVASAGGRFARIAAESKTLYHAAAVFGSNYVAAVLDIAQRLMTAVGIDDARAELSALARSAITNWAAHNDARRFTGPAARGDLEVIQRHLEALATRPEVALMYRLLADELLRSNLAPGE